MTDPHAQATDSVYVSNTTNVSKAIAHPQPPSTLALTTPQLQKYLDLPQHGKVIAEYVWIDADGGTRSKSKVSITHPFLQLSATCACNATVDTRVISPPRILARLHNGTRLWLAILDAGFGAFRDPPLTSYRVSAVCPDRAICRARCE